MIGWTNILIYISYGIISIISIILLYRICRCLFIHQKKEIHSFDDSPNSRFLSEDMRKESIDSIFESYKQKNKRIKKSESNEIINGNSSINNLLGLLVVPEIDNFPLTKEQIAEIIVNGENNEKNEELFCMICLENIKKNGKHIKLFDCYHKFHKHCIIKWLKKKGICPICKLKPVIEKRKEEN